MTYCNIYVGILISILVPTFLYILAYVTKIYKLAYITKIYNIFFSKNFIPKPDEFVDSMLQSGSDVSSIVTEINGLLPQLADFIGQFHNLVGNTGINVVTDSAGNMARDVPQNMPDSEANYISKKIGVIDRLITTHGQNINDLHQKGLKMEENLKTDNPKHVSQLSDQIYKFKNLNSTYKH